MKQSGFIAALAADLTFGLYHSPVGVEAFRTVWVIVAAWGESGDFLSVSLTDVPVSDLSSAPASLQPAATHLGILVARTIGDGGEESEYLLVRHRPVDVAVGGIFHPSDGYARILHSNGDLTLMAHGRYAHSVGLSRGQRVVHDIPDPAPGCDEAQAWHLSGTRRPWIGDFSTGNKRGRPRRRIAR